MESTTALAYLIGLLTGRGHILEEGQRLVVEFAHKDRHVKGVSHCVRCEGLVAKSRVDGRSLCKECGHPQPYNTAIIYDQVESTHSSLEESVIPVLRKAIEGGVFNIVGNDSLTLLTIDLEPSSKLGAWLLDIFDGARSYAEFRIPTFVTEGFNLNAKTEFINGLLDTAGFPSAGGWLNREGPNAYGRMRAYFQIVRNWKLVVDIDNFLRREFGLPVQTIDWGHPNIRDGNLKDYYESNASSWKREHQIKFFPEYYTRFEFRINHKRELFNELLIHNRRAGFQSKDDWFPIRSTRPVKVKANHPGEKDPRIPGDARTHFDAFWQINAALGCEYLKQQLADARYPAVLLRTGRDVAGNVHVIDQEQKAKRDELSFAAQQRASTKRKKSTQAYRKSTVREQSLYEPLTHWLQEHLERQYGGEIAVMDVSSTNLNTLVRQSADTLLAYEYCHNFNIKPDIVGFIKQTGQLALIEAKITPISLANIGQLLGYCLVAKPAVAMLLSTSPVSATTLRVIQANPDILDYGAGRIQIGQWVDGNKAVFTQGDNHA